MPRLRNGKRRMYHVSLPTSHSKRVKRSGSNGSEGEEGGVSSGGSSGGGAEGGGNVGGGGGGRDGAVSGRGLSTSLVPPCPGKDTRQKKASGGVKCRRAGAKRAVRRMTGTALRGRVIPATSHSDPAATLLESLNLNVLSEVISFLGAQETEALAATSPSFRAKSSYRAYIQNSW
ncbi:hypothetical protein Naga_100762g2 [Nannochloropsis gaditana]|uniref:F-box domain-containing protein n=1 Tax=Nannochloropsis gaditana TaxID=72520 RepID=W7T593_9STRA|nr:hypothetical protein Naga_100762g2 [Nannochloropsis gaditana]